VKASDGMAHERNTDEVRKRANKKKGKEKN
jgi:hypothetical protein